MVKGGAGTSNSGVKKGSSMWRIFFLGFIGGLLALLTPCVFPMIPLTVSFFTKGSEDKAKGCEVPSPMVRSSGHLPAVQRTFHLLGSVEPGDLQRDQHQPLAQHLLLSSSSSSSPSRSSAAGDRCRPAG